MSESDSGGRKTLLSRFKQIMGEKVELIDEPSNKASGKGKGTSVKSHDGKASSGSKRREQVLQAQRTHRQRTQTYMKMLEKEVIRLREQETSALKRAAKLQRQVDILVTTLASNGLSIPPAFHEDLPADWDPTGQVTTRTAKDPTAAFIHVEFPQGSMINRAEQDNGASSSRSQSHSSPEVILNIPSSSGYSSSISTSREPSVVDVQAPVPFLGVGRGMGTGPPLRPSPTLSDTTPTHQQQQHHHHQAPEDFISHPLQDPRVGIDFVLACVPPFYLSDDVESTTPFTSTWSSKTDLDMSNTSSYPSPESSPTSILERPCMNHIRGTHLDHPHQSIEEEEDGNKVSGHLFSACLSLWQRPYPERGKPASYEVSKSEIERLLRSSLALGLDQGCEITPVQIWNRIGSLSVRGGGVQAQTEALKGLVDELGKHVVCLHFGAVLDRFVVEPILDRYFVLPAIV